MIPSIGNLQRAGVAFLLLHGLERTEAETTATELLRYVLCYRHAANLIVHRAAFVDRQKRKQYFSLIRRRQKREPLQYIIGAVAFMDCMLEVTPNCLIPRPETEQLIEMIIREKPDARTCLDIGTGSGNIPIALAHYCPHVTIDAVDISEKALHIAKANAEKNNVAKAIHFFQSNVFSHIDTRTRYDVIISNPPYLSADDMKKIEPELLWEPRNALYAGEAGTEIITQIITEARSYLNDGGMVFLEIGATQGNFVRTLFVQCGYNDIGICKDYAGHDRMVHAKK